MKKFNLLVSLFLMTVLTVSFSACSDDDPIEKNPSLPENPETPDDNPGTTKTYILIYS